MDVWCATHRTVRTEWESPEDLSKFKHSALYAQFLDCFKLEDAPQSALVAATIDDYLFLDGLTSITTISFHYPATTKQHQTLDKLEGLGYCYMGPGLTMTKANVNYIKLRLREPQVGPTGERFEQVLVLHEWRNNDRRTRFYNDW
jgi:hypothetical protein